MRRWVRCSTAVIAPGASSGGGELNDLAGLRRSVAEPVAGFGLLATAGARVGQRNLYLHHLRGGAALAVVLYHCSEYLSALKGDDRFLSVFSGFFGAYGVAIFFAISGYLIAEVLRRDSPARFLMNRVARIYPLMLLAVGLFAVVFLLTGNPRGINALSLTLVPAGPRGYFLGVEWTLLYEMTYYVALGLLGLAGLGGYRTKVVVIWLGLLCFAYSLGGRGDVQGLPMLSEIPLSIVNLPFLLGYLASEALRRGWLHPLMAFPAVLLAVAGLIAPPDQMRLLLGVSAGLLIAAAISASGPVSGGGWLGRTGMKLGDASYALYLCHVPVILVLAPLLGAAMPTPLIWTIWLVVSVAVSLLLGPLDVSVYRRLKGMIDTASPRRLQICALSFTAAFVAIGLYAEREVRADNAELERARRILATPTIAQGDEIRADIDALERLPNGTWVVRGYAVDLARPDLVMHFAVEQKARLVKIVPMRRMRRDMALTLERPDLAGKRFGFMLLLENFDCADGTPEGFIIVEDGRVVKLAKDRLAAICGP